MMESNAINGGPDAIFQAALDRGEFLLQHCASCNSFLFYPRRVCPSCGKTALEWHAASGNGIVYSSTEVMRSAQQGGPYNVSIVQLDEGPRLMTRVVTRTGEVVIGAGVRMAIEKEDDRNILVFHTGDVS